MLKPGFVLFLFLIIGVIGALVFLSRDIPADVHDVEVVVPNASPAS